MSLWGTVRSLDTDALNRAAAELLRLLDGAADSAAAVGRGGTDGPRTRDPAPRGDFSSRGDGVSFGERLDAVTGTPGRAASEDVGELRMLAEALDARSAENRLALTSENAEGRFDAASPRDLSVSAGERFPAGERAAAAGAAAREGLPYTAAAIGADMEAVSEFFRRDSRRYDTGFGG